MKYRLTERGYEMEDGIVFTPYTQDNANAPASESKNDAPREMTAEDLGLTASDFGIRSTRRSRPTTEWFKGDLGLPRTIYAYGQYWHVVEPPDAPYAFWLGAETPISKPSPYLPSQLQTYADWSSV